MSDLQNAWKNKSVFQKQLQFNLKELEHRTKYPPHWEVCISLIEHFKPKSVLDIGCGCGALSEVFLREFPDIKYTGMDYSEDAIELAKRTWRTQDFHVKNVMDLTEEDLDYDLILAGALFDVMPNGDEAMEHVMKICSSSLLISRMKLTERQSYYTTYTAYDEIETCAYYHNRYKFVDMCEKYSYEIYPVQDNIYLVKK